MNGGTPPGGNGSDGAGNGSDGPRLLPPRFLLGANYWSRAGGPRMWERFDEAAVAAELAQLKAIGLDTLRMFAFVPTFMPRPPAVEANALAALRRFAELAGQAGLDLLPTPLVGHMSGENFDFAGQDGRSLYRDAVVLGWQTALAGALVDALRDAPAVIGWVLSNEMPLWATPPGTPLGSSADIAEWARTLVAAVRAYDGARPLGTGDGCMSGWPTRALVPLVDWIGPHLYYGDVDPLRQAWNVDFVLRGLAALGRPLILEEFGASSTQAGEAEQAAYVREVVLATLGSGGQGALIWCAHDFGDEVARTVPYTHHAFELGFGLLRADGSEKPVGDELRALRRLLDGVAWERLRRPRARVALVRPDYLEHQFPFSWEDRGALRRTLLQAYVLACQAGLDPDVVGEDDALDGYALVLCPATQKLRTATWLKLEAAARAGATVYWSYFSGDHEFHQGAWCPNFERLTGLRHQLRYGCFDLPGERCTLRGALSLSLPTGVAHSNAPAPLSRLPVAPLPDAAVESLAVDGDGNLALAGHRLGAGRVIFLAYPVERYLAVRPDGSSRDAHRLYRLLGDEAGVEPRYPTHHFDVQSRVLEDCGDDLVIVQHRGWTATVDDASDVPGEAELLYDRGNPSDGVFGPKGARVYRVRGVRR